MALRGGWPGAAASYRLKRAASSQHPGRLPALAGSGM